MISYEDHHLRGRVAGEIIGLFRAGLAESRRAQEIYEARGSLLAVDSALEMAWPGDLLLLQADVVDETVEFVRSYVRILPPAPLGGRARSGAGL